MSKLSLSPFDLPSPALAHFNRVAGSQSGQDKLFMVYQCGSDGYLERATLPGLVSCETPAHPLTMSLQTPRTSSLLRSTRSVSVTRHGGTWPCGSRSFARPSRTHERCASPLASLSCDGSTDAPRCTRQLPPLRHLPHHLVGPIAERPGEPAQGQADPPAAEAPSLVDADVLPARAPLYVTRLNRRAVVTCWLTPAGRLPRRQGRLQDQPEAHWRDCRLVVPLLGRLRRPARHSLTPLTPSRARADSPCLRTYRQIFTIRRSFQLVREERATVLRANRERIRKGDTSPESVKLEKDQLRVLANKERDLKLDCWVQAGYLPLTAHWCVTYLLSRKEGRPDNIAHAGPSRAASCRTTSGSGSAARWRPCLASRESGGARRRAPSAWFVIELSASQDAGVRRREQDPYSKSQSSKQLGPSDRASLANFRYPSDSAVLVQAVAHAKLAVVGREAREGEAADTRSGDVAASSRLEAASVSNRAGEERQSWWKEVRKMPSRLGAADDEARQGVENRV